MFPNKTATLVGLLVPSRTGRGRRVQICVAAASCLYLFLIVALAAVLRFVGERWWVGTLLLFGPRWIFALPLAVLLPAALAFNRRAIWIVGIATVVLMFPVMNFAVPWRPIFFSRGGGAHLRILTCNIHGHYMLPPELQPLMEAADPDVVVFQEWTSQDEPALFGNGRWYLRRDDELFIASRFPIEAADDIAQGRWGPAGSAVCYQLNFNGQKVPVICLHLASPHQQFEDAIDGSPDAPEEIRANRDMRAEQSNLIANYARTLGPSAILAGDFNTPPDSSVFREAWGDFMDAFTFAGLGFGNTYFTRASSSRIDHVLAGGAWRCKTCWVGPDVGSPHRPVMAELVAVGTAGNGTPSH